MTSESCCLLSSWYIMREDVSKDGFSNSSSASLKSVLYTKSSMYLLFVYELLLKRGREALESPRWLVIFLLCGTRAVAGAGNKAKAWVLAATDTPVPSPIIPRKKNSSYFLTFFPSFIIKITLPVPTFIDNQNNCITHKLKAPGSQSVSQS